MKLDIHLKIENGRLNSNAGNVAVFPSGENLIFVAEFKNSGTSEITLADPINYAETLLIFRNEESVEDTLVYLNPVHIDPTGEITAPVANEIKLAPNDRVEKKFALIQHLPDQIFPGRFQLQVRYKEHQSNTVDIGMQFSPESVSPLLEMIENENIDVYLRKEAIGMLQKLPIGIEYKLPIENETDLHKNQRIGENIKSIDEFKNNWNKEKHSNEIKAVFDTYVIK